MNIQLFGADFPPLYKIEDVWELIKKISEIDESINELAIEREKNVEALKEKIKKHNASKTKN